MKNGPDGPVLFNYVLAEPESYESPGWIRILNACTPYLPT